MNAVVLDASAFVEMVLRTSRGRRVVAAIREVSWHVPAHFDIEVFSAIGRLHRRGLLDAENARSLVAELAVIAVERHPVAPLLESAWHYLEGLSPADALYAELSRRLSAPLVTCDSGLAQRSPGSILIE